MKVLIACEESQRVCTAFRERGHEAYSCDIQEPSGGHPEWHILGDVLKVLNPYDTDPWGGTETTGILFETMNGAAHFVKKWVSFKRWCLQALPEKRTAQSRTL